MQFDVAPFSPGVGDVVKPAAPSAATDILRQILDVQREQLELAKAHQAQVAALAEAQNKKRSWFDRWQDEFPDLPESCRQVMPVLERAYLKLISSLVEEVRDAGEDGFESDFSVRDFVDRYGFALAHLGGILSALAPLTEVSAAESVSENE